MALMDLQSDLSRKDNPQERQKIIGRPSVTAIARDTVRVTKFLISPKGLLFTAKQFALQMMNPNVENITGDPGIGLTKIYDPISPITNTVGAPLGLRTDRHMPPIVRSNGPLTPSTYEGVQNSKVDSLFHLNNRLIKLKDELLDNKNVKPGQTAFIGKILSKIQSVGDKLVGFRGMPIQTLSSITGPNSLGGVGATTIRRYADTRLETQLKFTTSEPKGRGDFKNPHYYNIDFPYEDYPENDLRTENRPESRLSKIFTDPIEPTDVRGDRPVTPGHSKLDQSEHIIMPYNNIPTRRGKKELLDFRVLRKNGNTDTAAYQKEENRKSNFGNTLELIDTIDASVDESLIDFSFDDIAFKAYLGTISDNFAPTWNSAEDQGRADPRYQYGGFERTLSFDFIVVAYNKDQLIEIWNKLQNLARLTYPVYGSEGFFGQTTNVTIGKLFDERPMLIQDLGYDWDNETPWEIDEDYQSPFYTTVTMTCIVLGDRPQSTSQVYNITGLA